MTIQNQRPGVYSSYDISSMYATPLSTKFAAVVAKSSGGETMKLYSYKSYKEACEFFSPDGDGVFMRSIIATLFESGVREVLAVPVGDSYGDAFNLLETTENVGAIITDASEDDDLAALKSRVQKNSEIQRECLGFCGIDVPEVATLAAQKLNCERIVLVCPKVFSRISGACSSVIAAAAFAGKILAAGDAAANFNGEAYPQLTLPDALPESQIQSLLEAGVTVFESVGGSVECIRALTTRTKTGGVPDRSMAGVNTVLIIDEVMAAVRAALKIQLRGGRISGSPIESIRSQIVVTLAQKQSDGLLMSFATPHCYPSSTDPSVLIVELSFAVAHVVSQIHVTTHIQV